MPGIHQSDAIRKAARAAEWEAEVARVASGDRIHGKAASFIGGTLEGLSVEWHKVTDG
jgi:hypothetical protein